MADITKMPDGKAATIIEKLAELSKQSDHGLLAEENLRVEALRLSKQLTASLEKPQEAAIEMAYWPAYTLCARMAIEMGLFDMIAEDDSPKTAFELAVLSVRIIRALSGFGFIREVGEETYTSTALTHAMTVPAIQAGHKHFFDQGAATMVKMPAYFKEKGYKCPTDPTSGAFQFAFDTELETFKYWTTKPNVLANFNTFMSGTRGARPSWVEWYPIQQHLLDGYENRPDSVLLVDIAGSIGHDIAAFRAKVQDVPGRLVLEDLPEVINSIQKLDSHIEARQHDFRTPQPVKGARAYFFHFIFHDWSDDVCLEILANLAPAMKRGYSKLLLNEFILPDRGATLFPTGLDLNMMAMHAGMERTEKQWSLLLEKAGFKIIKFWRPEGDGEGVVEAMLK